VNVAGVKNVIGTFYQPVAVIYYTEFLKSLAFNEIKSGFGEVFKHDLLHDGSILNALLVDKTNLTEIIHDDSLIEEIIYRCIEIKKKYIIHDIEDKLGIRQALNLGHTLAHAIEILYNTTHGEAVAFGICFDLFLSKNVEYEFYYKLFKKFGYFDTIINIDILDCVETMKNDKKNKSGLITFVGLKEFGRPFEIYLTEDEINIKLTEFLNIIKSW
jgi:3-dehydroquinate synthase